MSVEIFPQDPVPEPDHGGARGGGRGAPGGSWPGGGDVPKRILFTLGAFAVCRLGTHIPLPGIDAAVLTDVVSARLGSVITMFDVFAGGALGRMSIFALGIFPYFSAAIIMLLLQAVIPNVGALRKEGEAGRIRINQYTRYLALSLCALQAYGFAAGLDGMRGSSGSAVVDSAPGFRLTLVVTLVAGTAFLIWLVEQINQRGVGNGIVLIIFAGIVAELPSVLAEMLALGRTGAVSAFVIVGIFLLAICATMVVVFVERAQRRIIMQYPKRQVGARTLRGASSHLPLKLNASGAITPIFATALLFPLTALLGWVQPLFLVIYVSLIVLFAFVGGTAVVDPRETADNLRQHGGFIPGIRPGEKTAAHLDFVHTRLTAVGAFYLSAICVVPGLLIPQIAPPFYFGGACLLIVVLATMHTVGQVHAHVLAQSYRNGRPPSDRD